VALSALRSWETFLDHRSVMASLKKPSAAGKAKRKLADISRDAVESDAASSSSSSSRSSASHSDSDSGSGSGPEDYPAREAEAVPDEPDEPVLSHAEKRRQKRRKLDSGDAEPVEASSESPTEPKPKKKDKKGKTSGDASEGGDALPKRQNSVWVGNLAYKTTAIMVKNFFEGLEITRIHMPLKAPPSGAGPKVNSGWVFYSHPCFERWVYFWIALRMWISRRRRRSSLL
jgi:hypothetical protein